MTPPKIVVFVGPTLAGEAAQVAPFAELQPPAKQGDLHRAARRGATVIGLIDGYFDQVNSVAHKEVLAAMSAGIHVLGAASMGALRAAELCDFGMEGVGAIFEQYRRGELEDDDEVAIIHGDAGDGYRPLSDAMVDIRATLALARDQGVVDAVLHDSLVAAAKARFFADRSLATLLEGAVADGMPRGDLERLRGFLLASRVRQKRADALELLDRLAAMHRAPVAPKVVHYFFSHTDAWEAVRRRAEEDEEP
jgi:hypothetical protein